MILLIFSEFPHKSEGKDSHPPSSASHNPTIPLELFKMEKRNREIVGPTKIWR